MNSTAASVVTTTPRDVDGPESFDDALRVFGLDDAWLRGWIVATVDSLYDRTGWKSAVFWIPTYKGYVAVGYPRVRTAYVRRDSVQYPAVDGWPVIQYPSR
ncbi:hypothetical protein [Promicromonospora sp. MEB111]|uniref:hypothetical protein n=1 Tax=Promicromonospora sp. MEB111 TaxID=3040301 RepID=UPI002549D2EB|nr:hypothetical protein [Promicromonospora sp. MEB111]